MKSRDEAQFSLTIHYFPFPKKIEFLSLNLTQGSHLILVNKQLGTKKQKELLANEFNRFFKSIFN
jgi:hypothetical protein